jgi:hypothetical protein
VELGFFNELLNDALIAKARKRLEVAVDEDGLWSLPTAELTMAGSQ